MLFSVPISFSPLGSLLSSMCLYGHQPTNHPMLIKHLPNDLRTSIQRSPNIYSTITKRLPNDHQMSPQRSPNVYPTLYKRPPNHQRTSTQCSTTVKSMLPHNDHPTFIDHSSTRNVYPTILQTSTHHTAPQTSNQRLTKLRSSSRRHPEDPVGVQ